MQLSCAKRQVPGEDRRTQETVQEHKNRPKTHAVETFADKKLCPLAIHHRLHKFPNPSFKHLLCHDAFLVKEGRVLFDFIGSAFCE